jgi:hypothetical protein
MLASIYFSRFLPSNAPIPPNSATPVNAQKALRCLLVNISQLAVLDRPSKRP